MATRTTTSSRFTLPARCLLFGDKGNGWQQLGQTCTWDEAERLRQDLAWVFRIKSDEIEILEIEDDERV
jgi:hypothetical protein